jgi:hypothetical protein
MSHQPRQPHAFRLGRAPSHVDVTSSNDNPYYTGTPGQIYNAGPGLGYPDLAKLAGDFRG